MSNHKSKNPDKTNIRSEEVSELIGKVPNWTIRWGSSFLFAIMVFSLILSWLVKYPETIQGSVIITTEQAPGRLISVTPGYIYKIHVANNVAVSEGEVLAEIRNPIEKSSIDSISFYLKNFSFAEVSEIPQLINILKVHGEAQPEISALYKSLMDYYTFNQDVHSQRIMKSMDKQIEYNDRLAWITKQELDLFKIALMHSKEKYKADSLLYEKEVISKYDFYKCQNDFIAIQQQLIAIKKNYVQHKIVSNQLRSKKNEFSKSIVERKRNMEINLQASINSLKKHIENWEEKYLIRSSMSGRISFLENITENQYVNAGQTLFAVIPDDENLIAVAKIPNNGYGKIEKGQKVMMKILNYPAMEYGKLMGEVGNISEISAKDGYVLKIRLKNGLRTTYNKEIAYQAEMLGTAEVITKDLRLIERIFYSIRKIFDR